MLYDLILSLAYQLSRTLVASELEHSQTSLIAQNYQNLMPKDIVHSLTAIIMMYLCLFNGILLNDFIYILTTNNYHNLGTRIS